MQSTAVQSSSSQRDNAMQMHLDLDHGRDELLTRFGKATLQDRYLLEGESFQDMFARVAAFYADDKPHAERLYRYMSNLWFMPATPILSNGRQQSRPAHLMLSERDARQFGRHRGSLE